MGHKEQTASQLGRALVAEFRESWYRIGTCSEPADRPRAEDAIARIYAQVGATPPRFLWCESPMTAQVALHILGGRKTPWRRILELMFRPSQRDQLGQLLHTPLGEWLGDLIQTLAKDALRAALLDIWVKDVPSALRLAVIKRAAATRSRSGSLRARLLLEPALEPTLRGTMRALHIPYRATPLRGQQEPGWIEYVLFFRDILRIQVPSHLSKQIDLWADLARSCHWWWPYRGLCVVSERPSQVHTSDEKRLHNDSGPAVRFRDGWSIWAIDGVVVDEQVVLHPDTQSARQIRREQNAEIKRIRIERFGWDHYLAEVGAVAIDRRRNDIEATRETLFQTPDRERILLCACPSTARVYALAVPGYIGTCEGAQAWLSGGLAGRIINGA